MGASDAFRRLAVFRIGFVLVLLVQAMLLAPSLLETHGSTGILQGDLMRWVVGPMPSLDWLTKHLAPLGLGEAQVIRGVFAAYLAGLTGLLLGWHTRFAAALAWAAHLVLLPSWHVSSYGVDQFGTIALFYLLVMPVGRVLALDLAFGRTRPVHASWARLALTVLRVHLCFVYLTSGIDKAVGVQWHDGEAIWRAVMQPQFQQVDLSWLAAAPWLAKLSAWGTLVVELGYAVFVWPKPTRRLWVALTVGLHLGIGLFLGIWLFAAAMIVLTVAAFGPVSAPYPAAARGSAGSLSGRRSPDLTARSA